MAESPQSQSGWRNQQLQKRRSLKSDRQKERRPLKWFNILTVAILTASIFIMPLTKLETKASSCPDLKVVFARGSGAERENNADFQTFKTEMDAWLKTTGLSYEITDLDYEAVGIENLGVLVGAYAGSGNSYKFGESVNGGVDELIRYTNNYCPDSKIVIAGYSQGALVAMKALPELNQEQIIYLATFGDPKIYLPEGRGILPAACRGDNLSDYRIYVPDCYVYEGLLGSVRPYEPAGMEGRVGTWCNKFDIFCSTHFNIADHTAYESSGIYADAAKLIYTKVAAAFNLKAKITPHDTVILIDSTGSMSSLIEKYKSEALRLAEETLNNGGRVALYDYRDLIEGYEPVEHCNFETCTLEVFQTELDTIRVNGGGDAFESALSASLKAMKALNWKQGSTKSLVILTDDGFLSPDRDGVTFEEVVKLSKEIDPVNFYVITEGSKVTLYQALAEATDGRVVSINSAEYLTLTDQILARSDSLPRVEDAIATDSKLPELEITEIKEFDNKTTVRFSTDGIRTMVILGEAILGIVEENEITISGITEPLELKLVPLSEDARGLGVTTVLGANGRGASSEVFNEAGLEIFVPKTPNTGQKETFLNKITPIKTRF